jgi:drug/metabolite transporter (DMT)-like permease
MNKTFVVSVVVLFVLSMALGFVVHGLILGPEYAKLVPAMFRSHESAQAYFPFMLAAHASMAIAVTWIYRQGREDKPVLVQGFRFGIALALLTAVPMYLIYFAVQPMPSDLVAQQIVLDAIATVILGIAAAAVNRG